MRKSKYSESDYIAKCNELSLNYIDTYKKPHDGAIIEFTCNKHLDKGIQHSAWTHFKNAKLGCAYCYGRHMTTADVQAKLKNPNVEIISEYLGSEADLTCKCKLCGNIWTTIARSVTCNGAGCPICGKEKASQGETKDTEQFIKELYEVNPKIQLVGEYHGTHRYTQFKCLNCNRGFRGMPSRLLRKEASCTYCNLSVAENEMLNTLNKLGINYISQYSIKDCKYQHVLKFDAFDIDNQVAFEYNGEQHYYPIDFAGKGDEWAANQLELTQARDNAKIEYCKTNGISIIIIPYWEKKNMESFITNELIKIKEEEKEKQQ